MITQITNHINPITKTDKEDINSITQDPINPIPINRTSPPLYGAYFSGNNLKTSAASSPKERLCIPKGLNLPTLYLKKFKKTMPKMEFQKCCRLLHEISLRGMSYSDAKHPAGSSTGNPRRRWVSIHSKRLKEILGDRYYPEIKQILIDLKVMDFNSKCRYLSSLSNPLLADKRKCYTQRYCLARPWYGVPLVPVEFRQTDGRCRQLPPCDGSFSYGEPISVDNHISLIKHSTSSLQFDRQGIEAEYQQLCAGDSKYERHLIYFSYLDDPANRYWIRDGFQRIYTSYIALPRWMKKHFTFQGKAIFTADVSSSHPALLATNYPDDSQEKAVWAGLMKSGGLYELLNSKMMVRCNLKDDDQKKGFKKEFFQYVLYGYEFKDVELVRVFQDLFPEMHGILAAKKKAYPKAVSHGILRREASIVIESVAKEFYRRHAGKDVFMLSIHDALATTEEYVEEVRDMLDKAYEKVLGFPVNVKTGASFKRCAETGSGRSIGVMSFRYRRSWASFLVRGGRTWDQTDFGACVEEQLRDRQIVGSGKFANGIDRYVLAATSFDTLVGNGLYPRSFRHFMLRQASTFTQLFQSHS